MSGPNRPSNITLRLLQCVALPPCQRLERSWTYGLTRPKYEWIWSTTLLTGRRLDGHLFSELTLLALSRYTTTALIFAETNGTSEAVGAWIYNITGSAM